MACREFVAVSKAKDKALQHGKSAFSRLEKHVEVGPCPIKSDLAHSIMTSECGAHAEKGTLSNASIHVLVVDENRQRT
jgi:hypothetical protein